MAICWSRIVRSLTWGGLLALGLSAARCASGGEADKKIVVDAGLDGTGGASGAGAEAGAGASGAAGKAGSGGIAGAAGESGSAGTDGGDASDAETDAPDAGDGEADAACSDNAEICNGLDDDCDGEIDEGDPGGGVACTVAGAQGVCADGVLKCTLGALQCMQTVLPVVESCNGLDDNCNGQVDDGNPGGNQDCNTGKSGICTFGTTKCSSGSIECVQIATPQTEICNGLDDDCNGTVDDGFPGAGQPCSVPGQPANTPCATGQTTCVAQIQCQQTFFPTAEKCDAVDNDCNGTIDDSSALDNKPCSTGQLGICSTGKTYCTGGVGTCTPDFSPKTETCNDLDDDCDGVKDDVADVNLDCGTKNPGAGGVQQWQCVTGGLCKVAQCLGWFKDCDGLPGNGCEVSSATDVLNCGACGSTCNSTNGSPTCSSGQCGIVCNTGFGNCDNDPTNGCEKPLLSDVSNCGACGKQCSAIGGTPSCVGGACAITCSGSLADCDGNVANGCETDTATSLQHCGGCGQPCSANNGTPKCSAGSCSIVCSAGFGDCDGNAAINGCETPLTTLANCTICGQICDLANATESCATGTCTLTSCNAGYASCDANPANGCEVNTQTDTSNCGGCGKVCSSAGGTAACSLGACTISCSSGFGNCDFDAANGCETSLTTLSNCGSCGKSCDLPNATESCSTGACQIVTCSPGYGNCDGSGANGCEAPLNTNSNCGGCGSVCALQNASASCVTGSCAISSCNSGFADCDGNPANGCEVSIQSDVANCGACGKQCSSAGGTASCSLGACSITCNAGFGNCDLDVGNGCEAPLSTLANCGACAKTCDLPNATESCTTGACTLGSCNAGWGNCDGDPANGCETNLLSDPAHCGNCATVCQPVGGSVCSSGSCQPTGCPAGKGDCDGNPANGCETDLTSSVTNCGACNNACNLPNTSTNVCSQSKCEVGTCSVGYANCDGAHANGCEVAIESSTTNCGSCGAPCETFNNTSRACSAGLCSYVCSAGFADCNGPAPGSSDDGCETVTSSDVNNCGGCGIQCVNPHGTSACVNALCSPTCSAGWGDCNGNKKDGCETSTTTVSNCGGCGIACVNSHGNTSCNGTTCVPSCSAGWGNCNGNPNDGCETDTTTTSNCGGCGIQCTNPNGSTSCNGTACVPVCNLGWGNCNGNPADGCETNVAVDPNNCGTCGHSCAAPNAQTSCVVGGCAIVSCTPGYYDLDKNPANGCEYKCPYATPSTETCDGTDEDCDGQIDEDFDKTSDPNNCGSCGVTCGSATGGLCCNSICKLSDPNNCGACGQVCSPGMLIINELMIDPAKVADNQGEWFELYNPKSYPIDIRGFVLKDLGIDTHTITSALPIIVPAGGYLVLGNNASTATNGGVPVGYQYGSLLMGNDGDELLVIAHGVELDRVVWNSTFDVSGKSKELSKNHQSITQNDVLTNWCPATTPYGLGDLGTPGAANVCAL